MNTFGRFALNSTSDTKPNARVCVCVNKQHQIEKLIMKWVKSRPIQYNNELSLIRRSFHFRILFEIEKKVHASLFDSRLLFFSSFHLREKKQQQQPERRQNMHIAHDYTQQQKKKKERKKRKHSLFIFVIIRQTLSI